jgi:hypothetical protein
VLDRKEPPRRLLTNSAFSWKFICTIVHRSPSDGREDGFCGPPPSVGKVYMLWWCIKIPGRE